MIILKIKKFLEKRNKAIKYIFFIICLAYLFYRSLEDFSKVDTIISKNYEIFFIVSFVQ